MHRRRFLFSATAAGFVSVAAPALARARNMPQDGAEWFTNVPVTTQWGETLRFYDDVMKGKVLLINFFFTDCDNVCPIATDNLVRVQELLGDRVGKDIRMVSISLQPEHDTPEVMAAYTRKHGIGPGWYFLTGQRDDIELLRRRLGFWDIDPVVDADPEQHLGTVRIANEPMHRWAMSPSLLNPPALVRAVHRVLPDFV
jgi:protein SCO1/2